MRSLPLALLLIAAPLPASAATWSTSPIDPHVGYDVSMIVDPAFRAHTAYWSAWGGFKYAVYDQGAWQLDSIPPTPELPGDWSAAARQSSPAAAQLIRTGTTSLALTPGTPWVAHAKQDGDNRGRGTLKVSHKELGAWVTEDIDVNENSSIHIAAGYDGTIYLAYQSMTLGPRFMVRNGNWTGEPLGILYGALALTLDRNGTPWILYTDASGLWVARRASPGVWVPSLVDEVVSSDCALAFDSQNRPCVAYTIQSVGPGQTFVSQLAYARWTGSAWVNTLINVAANAAYCEALVVDASDQAWIAYTDRTVGASAKVAHGSSFNWSVDFVDTPASEFASITLDALGRHWMAYNGSSNGLRMARTAQPTGIGDALPSLSALRLAIAGANPMIAGAETRLRIESPEAGAVRLETFDLSGRRVTPARSWTVPAGITTLPWTAPAAHGLCLVRATLGGRSTVARVMVVR
jgi:hypothetical protein